MRMRGKPRRSPHVRRLRRANSARVDCSPPRPLLRLVAAWARTLPRLPQQGSE